MKKSFLLFSQLLIVLLFSSCEKKVVQKEEPLIKLIVGNYYQGGIIVYLFQIGDVGYIANEVHGIIADTQDIGTTAVWGCEPKNIGTSRKLGFGLKNTDSIVIGCTTAGIASKLCMEYSGHGFSDWFLPSADELMKLYLIKNEVGNFNGTGYWSSTELGFGNAIFVVFSNGFEGNTSKLQDYRVRATRYF